MFDVDGVAACGWLASHKTHHHNYYGPTKVILPDVDESSPKNGDGLHDSSGYKPNRPSRRYRREMMEPSAGTQITLSEFLAANDGSNASTGDIAEDTAAVNKSPGQGRGTNSSVLLQQERDLENFENSTRQSGLKPEATDFAEYLTSKESESSGPSAAGTLVSSGSSPESQNISVSTLAANESVLATHDVIDDLLTGNATEVLALEEDGNDERSQFKSTSLDPRLNETDQEEELQDIQKAGIQTLTKTEKGHATTTGPTISTQQLDRETITTTVTTNTPMVEGSAAVSAARNTTQTQEPTEPLPTQSLRSTTVPPPAGDTEGSGDQLLDNCRCLEVFVQGLDQLLECSGQDLTQLGAGGAVLSLRVFSEISNCRPIDSTDNQRLEVRVHRTGLRALGPRCLAGVAPHVTHLYLHENRHLEAADPRAFLQLGGLRTLSLRNNRLSRLPGDLFLPLPALKVLKLSSNTIGSLPARAFSTQVDLEFLDLGHNRLRRLESHAFVGLFRLRRLYLFSNHLAFVHRLALADLGRLTHLHMELNRLAHLHPAVLDPLEHLEHLHLQNNRLEHLDEAQFHKLRRLKVLVLSDNHLTSLPGDLLTQAANLTDLNLSANRLTSLPPGLFRELGHLRWLALSGNPLAAFDGTALKGLTSLQTLYLARTSIASLDEDAFAQVTNLTRLKLDCRPGQLTSGQLTSGQLTSGQVSRSLTSLAKLHYLSVRSCDLVECGQLTLPVSVREVRTGDWSDPECTGFARLPATRDLY